MGRKKDGFWQYVDDSGNKLKCNFCDELFSGGASRIKSHLSGIKRKGIRACDKAPEHVKIAAASALDDSNKRVKSSTNSIYVEENSVNSDLPSDIPTNLPISPSEGHAKGYPLPTVTDIVGEQFERHVEKIEGWLMKDEVSVIGVWGMGGVGKTALIKHIHKRILESVDALDFDRVIWVAAPESQDFSKLELQKAIAKSMTLDISDKDDEISMGGKLLDAFKRINSCLLILDDLWNDIILEDVGIPLTHGRIKLILTTRLLDVCRSMNCKENILKVEPLCEKEAWKLFVKTFGDHKGLSSNSEVLRIAKSVAKQCEGLPFAIVTIARSMRGREDMKWWYALEKLEDVLVNGEDDMEILIIQKLSRSYNNLNEKLQGCFLLCLLFDYSLPIEKGILVDSFLYNGLINARTMLGHPDEGHVLVEKLENKSVLEGKKKSVRLHNLVRIMGLRIAKESHGYMVKTNQMLTEMPHLWEWKEDVQKVSLAVNDIKEIPLGISPRCPNLTTLVLNRNHNLRLIADDLFINMPALRELDLSDTAIARLPDAVSHLESLLVLDLHHCKSLIYVPPLSKLRQLTELDLSNTAITQLPLGMEMLINLTKLYLFGIESLKMSAASVLPKLTNLQVLFLDCKPGSMDVKAQDIQGLKKLEFLVASFNDQDEFNAYVKSTSSRGLHWYFLQLGAVTAGFKGESTDYPWLKHGGKGVRIRNCNIRWVETETALVLPREVRWLEIFDCHGWKCLCDFLSFDSSYNDAQLWNCQISSCDEMEYLFCFSSSCPFCGSLQRFAELELQLTCLRSLRVLYEENICAATPLLSRLTHLTIKECNGIKKLLTPGMSKSLSHLKKIRVESCDSLEEIFPICNNEEEEGLMFLLVGIPEIIVLPNLQTVQLRNLPKLNSVCNVTMACDSLQEFTHEGCPNCQWPIIQPDFQIIELL